MYIYIYVCVCTYVYQEGQMCAVKWIKQSSKLSVIIICKHVRSAEEIRAQAEQK